MSNATGGDQTPNWTPSHTAGCFVTSAAIIVVALVDKSTVVSWLLFMILMAAFTAIAADGITDSALGMLVDERHCMSLSRLQMALWTWLILSGFLAAAIGNVRARTANPLAVTIPQAVWLMLGISTTSLVGAPLIISSKRSTPPTVPTGPPVPVEPAAPVGGVGTSSPLLRGTATASVSAQDSLRPPVVPTRRPLPPPVAAVLRSQGEDPSRMWVEGSVVVKHSISDASWADLFKGEGAGEVAILDLAQIQMFFFTVVLVLSYAIALGTTFNAVDASRLKTGGSPVKSAPILPPAAGTLPVAAGTPAAPDPRRVDEFPPLDSGLVTLFGISNAGFLANKVIPRPQPAA